MYIFQKIFLVGSGHWEKCLLHCWPWGIMSPYITLGLSEKSHILVIRGNNASLWSVHPLHWWPSGTISLPLMVSENNVPYDQCEECPLHSRSLGRTSLTFEVSGMDVPYIGGHWKECPLHGWSLARMSLTLEVIRKNVPYIGGQKNWTEVQ